MLIVKYEKRGYPLFLLSQIREKRLSALFTGFKPILRVDYTKIIKKAGNLFNQEIIFY